MTIRKVVGMDDDRIKAVATKLARNPRAEGEIRKAVGESFGHYAKDSSLRLPAPQLIRAGRKGGLPFDALTTDLMLGCLPATQICYGNCFAARGAFEAGFDFGQRVPNILDEEVFLSDLEALPPAQHFVRNGWNSDPSWDWTKAARLAEIVASTGRFAVFISKGFKMPDAAAMRRLASARAEFRISISAFDTASQLEQRLRIAERYREHDGVAVPVVMSARFRDESLARKQDELVEHLNSRDFPTAENSIRFRPQSPVIDLVDLAECGREASSGDYWSGRLYTDLRVPTLTSVPPDYRGMQSPWLSKNDAKFLATLWHDPVRTHEEVMSKAPMEKPQQCGVAMSWSDMGAVVGQEETA